MRPAVIPFFIPHLGCPHRCVFCDQHKIAGARGGLPGAEEMLARIAQYREGAPDREFQVAFYGGTFTALSREEQRDLLEPLQPLVASGAVSSLRLSTRPDAIEADNLSFLKAMGVAVVELGVQSMNEEVLRLSCRGHGAGDVERAVSLLRQAGLEVGIQLMPGLPGDTSERSLASLDQVLALKPSFLRIYPTLVVAGTALAELYRAGSYQPLSLDEAVGLCTRMLQACRRAGVPVIRLGLQPTAELGAPGVLLAGPYHPAFGQLVESELCYDAMCELLEGVPAGEPVTFLAPAGRISDLVGQGRRNVTRLADHFGVRVHGVIEDAALPEGSLALSWSGGRRTVSAAGDPQP